jgi:hypothetical protein
VIMRMERESTSSPFSDNKMSIILLKFGTNAVDSVDKPIKILVFFY